MSNVCLIGFVAGLVGARMFHLLEYPRDFLEHPWSDAALARRDSPSSAA